MVNRPKQNVGNKWIGCQAYSWMIYFRMFHLFISFFFSAWQEFQTKKNNINRLMNEELILEYT